MGNSGKFLEYSSFVKVCQKAENHVTHFGSVTLVIHCLFLVPIMFLLFLKNIQIYKSLSPFNIRETCC